MTNEQIEEELRIETEVFMEDQPLNEEDEALVDLIYDRLDIFVEMNQPYHDKAREARVCNLCHSRRLFLRQSGRKTPIRSHLRQIQYDAAGQPCPVPPVREEWGTTACIIS